MKMIQDIIVAPIVTENSMEAMQHKKYTFKVMKSANKVEIAKAVEAMFPGTKVAAKSQSLVEDVIEDYDLLLIGPHFASHKDEFDELAGQYGIPVEVIPQSVYGSLDGNGLIDFALDVLNKS